MTFASKAGRIDHPVALPSAETAATSAPSGRERRVHHRRAVVRVWAQIDDGWYKVHDLSLGGLAVDTPVDRPRIGSMIDGELHSRADDRHRQSTFRASVVRVDSDRIGLAYEPMEPEQIDGLLSILSAVERDFVHAQVDILRREALRVRLRRLGYVAAILAVVAVTVAAILALR